MCLLFICSWLRRPGEGSGGSVGGGGLPRVAGCAGPPRPAVEGDEEEDSISSSSASRGMTDEEEALPPGEETDERMDEVEMAERGEPELWNESNEEPKV